MECELDRSAVVRGQRVLVVQDERLIGGGLPFSQTMGLVEAEPVGCALLDTGLLLQQLAAATAGSVQS